MREAERVQRRWWFERAKRQWSGFNLRDKSVECERTKERI
ncbi:uncharacterized protein G2W53_032885 [Senna tora]|uniref:Uncharacterized protein n=1 Tax=Senna tora TaxID=362788 RepID=A0A834WC96_9FABA|nr:uncharacterized protein G2W53_032885 [Senna tora]